MREQITQTMTLRAAPSRCTQRQRDAAHQLAGRFGEQFTYVTGTGPLAISQGVLRAFRKPAGGPSWD